MSDHHRIVGHGYLAWIEGDAGLICVDTGWDLATGGPYEGSTLEALVTSSEATGKPLTNILLTHHHPDHVGNLPMLRERWPAAEVTAHPANIGADMILRPITTETTFTVQGVTIQAIPTPGHSHLGDELSFWLPPQRFLFPGDIAQPQGPSYSKSTGPAPVPFFADGDAYLQTLDRLLSLDINAMRTGHGDLLGPEQSRQWLRVTYATVNRIAEVAMELVERYPDRDSDWLCESVYDRIADERGVPFREAQARKKQVSFPERGLSDYEIFDKPGIRYWVEASRP